MFSVITALLVTIVVGYFILKKYKPQAVLLAGGIFLMILTCSTPARSCLLTRAQVSGCSIFLST